MRESESERERASERERERERKRARESERERERERARAREREREKEREIIPFCHRCCPPLRSVPPVVHVHDIWMCSFYFILFDIFVAQRLVLQGLVMKPEGTKRLANALPLLPLLIDLDVRGNRLGSPVGNEGVCALLYIL